MVVFLLIYILVKDLEGLLIIFLDRLSIKFTIFKGSPTSFSKSLGGTPNHSLGICNKLCKWSYMAAYIKDIREMKERWYWLKNGDFIYVHRGECFKLQVEGMKVEKKKIETKTKYKKRGLHTSTAALFDETLGWMFIGTSVLDGASAVVVVSGVANGGALVGALMSSWTYLASCSSIGSIILGIRRNNIDI